MAHTGADNMDTSAKTILVIPCYNEERRLKPALFSAALKERPWLNFMFVNDGSQDATDRVLEEFRRREEGRVEILNLARNSGKAEAVRRGMLSAAQMGPEIVGYWDADLSAPFSELDGMCNCLVSRQAFAVYGSRVRMLGKNVVRQPSRHYLGRLFATMASIALDLPVYDTQCGAKLFANRKEVRTLFELPFVSRWIFDAEILARFKTLSPTLTPSSPDTRVVEYPLDHWCHDNETRLTKKDFFVAAFELARLAYKIRF